MNSFSVLILSLLYLTIILSQGIMAEQSPNPFTVSMSLERLPTKLNGHFSFTNNATTKEDYYLSRRYTPLEGIGNRFLKVTCLEDGSDVLYQGILAKRLPPTKDEFTLVKYGQTISATVELNSAYIFEKDGRYRFEYERPLAYLTSQAMDSVSDQELPQGGFNYITLASAEIDLVNVNEIDKPRFD